MARYGAVIDGKKGAYGVVIPDLPGCTAMGKTVDQALRNAADAARDWAIETKAAGRPVPKPRAIEALVADPEVTEAIREGGVVAMVPLLLDAGYPRTANISLDAGLLEAIDGAAKARGLTRSAFIATAAREKITEEG